MLLVLYGPNSYNRLKKIQEIKSAYQKKYSATIATYALDSEEQKEAFLRDLHSVSLFAPTKLLHVTGYVGATDKKTITLMKENIDKKTPVIILESEKKPPKEYAFLKNDLIKTQEFEYPQENEWQAMVQKKAKEYEITLTKEAVAYLAELNEKNTWKLVHDIEKLALTDKRAMTKEECQAIIGEEKKEDFFSLTLGLRSGQQKQRLKSLQTLKTIKEDMAKIFNIAASMEQKSARAARLDVLIKSGRLDYEEAVLALALEAIA